MGDGDPPPDVVDRLNSYARTELQSERAGIFTLVSSRAARYRGRGMALPSVGRRPSCARSTGDRGAALTGPRRGAKPRSLEEGMAGNGPSQQRDIFIEVNRGTFLSRLDNH